jgi:hypothetical protein
MSDKETAMVANKLSSDIEFKDVYKSKKLYQHFTYYFIAIMFIFVCSTSISILYFYQQSKQTQTVVSEQLAPLQTQFLQQVYLIKASKMIDELLQNFDANHFITLQRNLSLQSKKLTLLASANHKNYQQWFIDNNTGIDMLTRVESSHSRNKTLKNNTLIQLDTLLDAIEIQLKEHEVDSETSNLLLELQRHLSTIVTLLQGLNLQTSLGEFKQLKANIDEVLVADYGKILANQQNNDLAMEEIVRDFIRFEDLVLKRGLLAKWQGQLRLMDGYRQQLVSQQQQLQSILDGVAESAESSDALMKNDAIGNGKLLAKNSQPIWLWLSFLISLLSISAVLWLIRLRIKTASQFGVEYINFALDGTEPSPLNSSENGFVAKPSKAFYCAESWQLLEKIHQLNNNRYTEAEYLILMQENKALAEKISKDENKQDELTVELELFDFNVLEKSKSQSLLEQQRCENLHLVAIKQLVLLGCGGVNNNISTIDGGKFNNEDNFLYHAHTQGRDLVRKLREASCYRYLQTNDVVLTLSDVNIIAQIQGILLNLEDKLSQYDNSISMNVDEKIQSMANVDVELFTELLSVFIRLLISQQTQKRLVLRLQLIDKNSGQQKIYFSGEVLGKESEKELPNTLKHFNETSSEQSELAEYFNTLLKYQHGEDAAANLTEEGYQLCFALPLAVTENMTQQSYPVMALPERLSALQQVSKKLKAKYKPMPIEVLLAVNEPIQYRRLQQLLKFMGLQVTFATNESMLHKSWHSGRFAVLITELTCAPFIDFIVDEVLVSSQKTALPRGVFTVDTVLSFDDQESDFSHWNQGKLSADSSIDELMTAMSPWLKEKARTPVLSNTLKQTNTNDESDFSVIKGGRSVIAATMPSQSFNFELYIKHQGSAELALYMLEEYTSENTLLVERLSKAFTINDVGSAEIVIEALMVNARILAAGNLLKICQQWQKLITKKDMDNSNRHQTDLLDNTKLAINAINLHAESVA